MAVAASAATVAAAVMIVSAGRTTAGEGVRLLSQAEMVRAFGDAPAPRCKKEIDCSDGLRELSLDGQSICVKCVPQSGPSSKRWICCIENPPPPVGASCTYTGGIGICSNYDRYEGPTSGMADPDCGTCTSSSYVQNGNCTGVTNAVSTRTCP
ncbi:MAG: hypothetical protein U0871_04530 [Gemmataceae bacterium]